MSDPNETPGWDYIEMSHGRRAIRLYGFPTDSAEVQPEHQDFLRRWVADHYGNRSSYYIVGMASDLRFRRDSERRNTDLSLRRARAVEDFILQVMLQLLRSRGAGSGVTVPNFNVTVVGVGTLWNTGDDAEVNDIGHRAVLIMDFPVHQAPELRITGPEPTLTRHRVFYIKYCGGVGGDVVVVGMDVALFIIRDSDGWYQKYFYAGGAVGPSAPSWGEGMPPGQGWVEFRTREGTRVDDFGGTAQLSSAEAQAPGVGGVGINNFTFGFGRGPLSDANTPTSISVMLETGDGFALGVGTGAGALFTGGIRPRHDNGWRHL